MTEICSIIHKCTIHGEKNYMNLDFSSPLSGSHPDGASKKRRLAVYNAQTTEFKSYCIVTSREFLEVVVVTGIMLDALTMALSHYLQNYACHTKPPQEVLDLYRKNRMQ